MYSYFAFLFFLYRVSFGSNNGSMVETLIIDDTMPAEEQDSYQQQNGEVFLDPVQKTTHATGQSVEYRGER